MMSTQDGEDEEDKEEEDKEEDTSRLKKDGEGEE